MSNRPDWDPHRYEQAFRFVSNYGEDMLTLLDPQPDQRIVDIGCGTGHLTSQIHEAGAEVVGIDSSIEMIRMARQQYPNIKFLVRDARDVQLDERFDAVFSNAALHWIPDAEQVIQQIQAVLKPGGRLVAELGGSGNVHAITTAIAATLERIGALEHWSHPWYFPSPATYASLLEANGFRVRLLTLFDRPTFLEGHDGLRNWVKMFLPEVLETLTGNQQIEFFTAIEDHLRHDLFGENGWAADYVRLRVVAERL